MNDVAFIAPRIAAQTIRMSEAGIRKLASILIRKELKEGAIFLDENETFEQISYIYKKHVSILLQKQERFGGTFPDRTTCITFSDRFLSADAPRETLSRVQANMQL